MDVIHFTRGATDPLISSGTSGAHSLPLADGEGDACISCIHLEPGAIVQSPLLSRAAAVLVVHGRIKVTATSGGAHLSGGMGCVLARAEAYSVQSWVGAIILVVETDSLTTHICGISTPERISGQTWPSDVLVPK